MRIAEDFFSVQGEGVSTGIPSYFVRLQGCNLMCGGRNALLLKIGQASWYCDTEAVWRQGTEVSNSELVNKFDSARQLERILDGQTHLIWTGGEPTLPNHQKAINNFHSYLDVRFDGNNVYSEIETNGTIKTQDGFYRNISQINCSPKLTNSGEASDSRINPSAIEQILSRPNSWFKFVISKEDDVKEAESSYILPFKIPQSQVILMPACDSMFTLPKATEMCYDLTKKYGYRTITRGHIVAWNKTTGV